ncbi:xanthine dehydrogenase family protein molybdopterin-binding subunit [Azospirillum sp. SYSU D00513]|uniref:xanthine dehydrogenase family protein molybdopterin-binding subunit n=1 Tax=Azospirillum sp. SYSU D00513 TaxID=2812561 RepID=UPI001A961D52|nr:xanthine dehydrogenase family protein molybdopterin-binding subunit [Azospirillum sp. SYSU D00513]
MSVTAPEPKRNMGQPVPRVDARLKVTGEARYPADVPLNNLAHGVLVTSDIARGRIKRLDLAEAKAVQGVIEILTHENARELKPLAFGNAVATSISPLAEPRIWHDGQIIALVLADTYEAAREAAYRVKAEYDTEPPSAGFGSAGTETVLAKDVTETHKEDPAVGDVEAALRSAAVTIDVEYSTPTQHHNPIELFSTTCAWAGDQLTVYEPSQFVYGYKHAVAKQLGIDPRNVRVISQYIGGAFGSKGPMTPRTGIVALAAKRINRPVRCVVTRQQGFTTTTYRAETRHRIRIGATPDGKITGFSHEGWEITSRPDAYVVAGTDTTSRLYGYGAVWTRVNMVKADRNTPGYMRSPPELPYNYALESAMDELAVALKMDPVELRRVNDTMKEPIKGLPYTSRPLMQCYDEAAASFGWSKRNPAVGSMREDDWLIGWGCATAVYPTNMGAAAARVRLSSDGSVRVQTAAHEIGTGAYTVIGQMAAERLGVGIEAVNVELGDTALPPAPVAGGSNTTATVCSTVLKACDAIRDKLFRAAVAAKDSPLAGRDPAQLELRGGTVQAGGASEKLSDLFARMGSGAIEEYAEWMPAGFAPESIQKLYNGTSTLKGGSKGDKMMYAFGAEFVEVRIHARTREIRVPRIVGAFAGGRIMNTRTARSQLMGGMIWGIGSALHEKTEIDPRAARYLNKNISEYLIPVNADIQQLEVILVPEEDREVNPAGIKGLGELGNVGTAAAIAAAVYHATGKRIRDLPIRLENLLST